MRTLVILLTCLFSIGADAQKPVVLSVNPSKDNMGAFERSLYYYRDFEDGKLIYHDSSISEARMNFHRFFDQVHFISPKNDTLTIKDPAAVAFFIIGTDTFLYNNRRFYIQQTHLAHCNLLLKPVVKYMGREKIGAYGTYNSIASIDEFQAFSMDEFRSTFMNTNAILKFEYRSDYFLSDSSGKIVPADKANLIKLFPDQKEALKSFLKEGHIDFNSADDLVKLTEFINNRYRTTPQR